MEAGYGRVCDEGRCRAARTWAVKKTAFLGARMEVANGVVKMNGQHYAKLFGVGRAQVTGFGLWDGLKLFSEGNRIQLLDGR